MIKKIVIVSATSNNNLNLSKTIKEIIIEDFDCEVQIINLEEYYLPLFTEKVFDSEKKKYSKAIEELTSTMVESSGIIFCAPEYNGSIPPIVTNFIAWVSMSTKYWRDAFNEKVALIGTFSGGAGGKFLSSMKLQLEHLGAIVMPRNIIVNNNTPLKSDSVKKILKQFIKFLN